MTPDVPFVRSHAHERRKVRARGEAAKMSNQFNQTSVTVEIRGTRLLPFTISLSW